MHPMFVALFIETNADDLLAEEQDRKHAGRLADAIRRSRGLRS